MMTRLAEYRTRGNLSRSKLAALAGIDPQTVYRLEKGTIQPHLTTAYALVRALSDVLSEEILVDDLFPHTEEASA